MDHFFLDPEPADNRSVRAGNHRARTCGLFLFQSPASVRAGEDAARGGGECRTLIRRSCRCCGVE
ncbi:hypothetical protein DESC_180073 [Desulfosarcina cetonica]|nr:hypothetical protein DESC_180073 [Desulfosarcina cetonica]